MIKVLYDYKWGDNGTPTDFKIVLDQMSTFDRERKSDVTQKYENLHMNDTMGLIAVFKHLLHNTEANIGEFMIGICEDHLSKKEVIKIIGALGKSVFEEIS